MTRALSIGLMVALFASPLRAQTLSDAISRAASETAISQAQDERREGIPRGFLWTGIGLLAAGGLSLAIGAAAGDETACVSIGSRFEEDCVSIRKVALITGGVLAGTGGALLGIGISKSHHSPTISVVRGGVVVRQRLPLNFPKRRAGL